MIRWVLFSLAFSIALEGVVASLPWTDFRVRFSTSLNDGYYEMPKSLSDPLIQQYVEVKADLSQPVRMYCYPNDPRVCLMFDYAGNIAGIQISYLQRDVTKRTGSLPYDYSKQPLFVYSELFGEPAYALRAWFTNPDLLTNAGRKSVDETAEGVYLYNGKNLMEMPREIPLVNSFMNFTRQSCLPGMGQHYFYNLSPEVHCENLQPFFLLYDSSSIVGFGIVDFGESSFAQRQWFENPGQREVDYIAPYRPACLDDWVNRYGVSSVHVYLGEKPWGIRCPA